MDKLEPILKQKFWIILGVGLILCITGWWMATSSLAATITQRKTEIDGAVKGIPTGEVPNNDWSTKLAAINERQESMVKTVSRQMWDQQKAVMTWPENVRDFAEGLPYRGEFPLVARDLYRSSYLFAAEDVWKQVAPIQLDGTGVVMFPFQSLPQHPEILGDLAPKSSEIWDAQEDLWLLVPILRAIREVNGGENGTRLDASIHVIDKLELMGGERVTGESSSASADMGMGGADMMGMPGMGGMGNMGARGGDQGGKIASADFNPEEEFGTTGRQNRSGGGADFSMAMMSADGSGMPGEGTEAPQIRRYVDDDESAPYKTRAFYLSVVMDHRRVPHLLGELTASGSSPWPIEVMRVQMARVNPDDAEGRSLTPGMTMTGPMDSGMGMNPGFSPSPMPEDPGGAMIPGYPGGAGMPGQNPGALAGQLSFDTAMQDPFVSKVAIAGLIYLYRPVDVPTAEGQTPEGETPEGAVPEALPGELPTEGTLPADPTMTDAPSNPDAPLVTPTPGAAPSPDAATPANPTPAPAATDPATPAPTTPAPAAAPPAGEATPAPVAPAASPPPDAAPASEAAPTTNPAAPTSP